MRVSLAEQIAQLDAPPVDVDPEDAFVTGAHSEGEEADESVAAAREHYVDVGPSALRRNRDGVADPKYDGERTTRKALAEESEGGEPSESQEGESESGHDEDEHDENDEPSKSQEEEEEDESERESRQDNIEQDNVQHEHDVSTELKKKREDDKRKGKAVSRQIAIWDALLEARIRMQKAVTTANTLPKPSDMDAYMQQPECRQALDKMVDEALLLADELDDLQEHLLTKNEGISLPPRKRRKLDNANQQQLQDASEDASALEHAIHPWIIQTLNKWSAKIQAVAPSVLLPSNRNAFSKSQQHLKSAVQLAEETLRDHDKLLARSRIRRGKESRLGTSTAEAADDDLDVFDDMDFYQQLLRDVIDSKGNGGGVDDWMAVQKEKKAKKKVDTKASKGRKIRYHVHEKMQNFMVPVPVVGAWHEEQIDELFASLLGGNGFEEPAGARDTELDEVVMSGFQVFG